MALPALSHSLLTCRRAGLLTWIPAQKSGYPPPNLSVCASTRIVTRKASLQTYRELVVISSPHYPTNLTTPAMGRENSQNRCRLRVQEWTYLAIGYRGHVGVLIVKNFVIVTPAHPEVTSRNWAIHAPQDMEKCGDLDPPTC